MIRLKVAAIAALFIASSFSGMAQERKSNEKMNPDQRSEKIVERMDKNLNLSPEQKKRMKELHLQNENLRSENHKLAIQRRDEHKKRVDDILTPEQRLKHKELMEKHKKDTHKPRPARTNPEH